jgi:thymidylate synthase ThyX
MPRTEQKKVTAVISKDEQQLLSYFVTNLDSNVYGFKNLPQVVMGAIFAAYSRSPLTAREILLKKFLGDEEFQRLSGEIVGLMAGEQSKPLVDPEKAEAFYSRVLVQYGDDSVAELGVNHTAIESVSNIVAKLVEDRRIGLNPLEKSSRYVQFNDKNQSGEYNYHRPAKILTTNLGKTYIEAMDLLFDTYSTLLDSLKRHLSTRFPKKEGQSDTAYNTALRAQACDVLRYLLPMGTLTNLGVVGNGRAYEYLIQCLLASPFPEAHTIAHKLLDELRQTLPAFVRRIETERGQESVDYLRQRREYEFDLQQPEVEGISAISQGVRLMQYDQDGETRVAAAMLYESSSHPLDAIQKTISHETKEYVRSIIRGAYTNRKHRTHKVSRAFEHTHYAFDIVCDIGAFRDLHRHRILTQQRQAYTTDLGYFIPEDIYAIGAEKEYRKAMDSAKSAFDKLRKKHPFEAQYVVPFGYFIRFTMRMNAREAFHLCELRSTEQGHWSYRFVAQEMARAIEKVHPAIGEGMMIDWSEGGEMARLKAEQRQEEKLKQLGLERDY